MALPRRNAETRKREPGAAVSPTLHEPEAARRIDNRLEMKPAVPEQIMGAIVKIIM